MPRAEGGIQCHAHISSGHSCGSESQGEVGGNVRALVEHEVFADDQTEFDFDDGGWHADLQPGVNE